MRTFLNSICILSLAGSLAAQTASRTAKAKASENQAEKPAAAAAGSLPSEATVDSFLHQQFGYETDLTWKISSIKPSAVAGLAEVAVVLASPRGQQLSSFFVAPDGQHALVGEIIPFGARPFDPAKRLLDKGITGPEIGRASCRERV